MRLGSSLRRRRGLKDPSDAPRGARPGEERPPLSPAKRTALTVAVVLLGGFTAGWVLATRVLFPPPPAPGDLYEVPDVYGLRFEEATQRIVDAGLAMGEVETFRHPAVDSGRVAGQDPLPGQLARPGREVHLSVSTGSERRAVPDLANVRGDRARERLEAAGFSVVVDSVESDRPRGRVVSSDPPAGTRLAAPSEVHLRVSLGPAQIAMPNVIGMEEAQARDTLTGLGFVLAQVEESFGFEAEAGRVVGQDPPPSGVMERGSAVRIVIGRRAPRPDTIPGG